MMFTRNPSPLQSSLISNEYLLLPPRSALSAVQLESLLVIDTKRQRLPTQHLLVCWLSISILLQRYPFSGLVNSAGELLHIP